MSDRLDHIEKMLEKQRSDRKRWPHASTTMMKRSKTDGRWNQGVSELIKANSDAIKATSENVLALTRIAEIHERRLSGLEGNPEA